MYDNAHFTKSKAIRNENAHLDCWKKFQGNAHLDCWKKIREMRNWIVAKNWQMRNYLLFYANLPGDFMRKFFVAYGTHNSRKGRYPLRLAILTYHMYTHLLYYIGLNMIWKYEISGIYFVAMSSLDMNPDVYCF